MMDFDAEPEEYKFEKTQGTRPRRITHDMLLGAASMTRDRTDSVDQYFERVTHLHLQAKRIKQIEGLEKLNNLKVLYLYDNLIEVIEGIDHAKLLSYLYLQNNMITCIPRLNLANLRKLYLDDNEIFVISGLETCTKLEELYVARQRLPKYQSLGFEQPSLDAVAQSLIILDVSGNSISNLHQFSYLRKLRTFNCASNDIKDINEIQSIVKLHHVVEANFSKNPCCTVKRYRDFVVGWASDALRSLDGVDILKHQQQAIKRLQAHRQKLGYGAMRDADMAEDFSRFSSEPESRADGELEEEDDQMEAMSNASGANSLPR